ncbi:LysR family transcriptional regulator [Vibrio sp.]|nr:LysR family transcriptional regulator [Vibrio sp.]
MVEYISDLRLFITISRTLNFREAGERLGYSPAVVTTRMQRLEAMTGKTLFIRSTRNIKLTEEGHQMVRYVEQMLDLSELISRPGSSGLNDHNLKGVVRVTAPHSFARLFLQRPLQILMKDHPELTIDLLLEDGISKIVEEEIDISFRVGGESEPFVESHPLFKDSRILVASPDYIQQYGEPSVPSDLSHHRCLTYSHGKFWHIYKENRVERIPIKAVLMCNTGDFLTQLALSGGGITTKSWWSVSEELQSGSLVRVLSEYTTDSQTVVHALLPKRDYMPARVTYVLDTIKSYIKELLPEEIIL